MHCKNHAGVEAVGRCVGCSEAFCPNCLVDLQGKSYCGDCKVMAVSHAPVIEEAMIPCPEAGEALKYAIIGIFGFGVILVPMAIAKALKARKMIAMNPRLSGSGQATAALIIGVIVLILWVIGMMARFSTPPGTTHL